MRLYPVERHKSPDYEKVHKACETLMLRLPSVMGDQILQAVTDVSAKLPKDILNLTDYEQHLEARHGVRILYIEMCWCWFRSMTRASSAKKRRAPDSWHAFRRAVWGCAGPRHDESFVGKEAEGSRRLACISPRRLGLCWSKA